MHMCVCFKLLTQQVLHALSRLDDLSADRGAADAVQDVISFGDDLNAERKKPCIVLYWLATSTQVCRKDHIITLQLNQEVIEDKM